MKIGFFTDAYNPKWYFGVEAAIESFQRELEKLGHEVYIYAPHVPGLKDKNPRIYRFVSFKAIKKPEMYLALPFFANKELLKNSIKIFGLKFDIVHVHTPLTIGLLGKYLARYQKIPLVCTYHTQYSDYTKFYFKDKVFLPKIAEIIVKWHIKGSQAVIVPSLKIKKLLRNYKIKTPIYILPAGVNTNFFKPVLEKQRYILRKRLNFDIKKRILLFVGRVGKEKNVDFLFEVLKEILKKRKDVVLVLVGGGPDLERLKTLTKKWGIEEFVKFTGQVPHSRIFRYYQIADLFVFPSLTETQGIVVLEAMASGLPVIILKDEAFSDIIFDGKNGFIIEKPLPEEFARKTVEFLENPSLYKNFSFNCRQIAEKFSCENQTKKLLKIYQDLIKKER